LNFHYKYTSSAISPCSVLFFVLTAWFACGSLQLSNYHFFSAADYLVQFAKKGYTGGRLSVLLACGHFKWKGEWEGMNPSALK